MTDTATVAGFNIEHGPEGASSTCLHCTSWRPICSRCLNPTIPADYRIDPPWGASDSRMDIRVCRACWVDLINLVRASLRFPPFKVD